MHGSESIKRTAAGLSSEGAVRNTAKMELKINPGQNPGKILLSKQTVLVDSLLLKGLSENRQNSMKYPG